MGFLSDIIQDGRGTVSSGRTTATRHVSALAPTVEEDVTDSFTQPSEPESPILESPLLEGERSHFQESARPPAVTVAPVQENTEAPSEHSLLPSGLDRTPTVEQPVAHIASPLSDQRTHDHLASKNSKWDDASAEDISTSIVFSSDTAQASTSDDVPVSSQNFVNEDNTTTASEPHAAEQGALPADTPPMSSPDLTSVTSTSIPEVPELVGSEPPLLDTRVVHHTDATTQTTTQSRERFKERVVESTVPQTHADTKEYDQSKTREILSLPATKQPDNILTQSQNAPASGVAEWKSEVAHRKREDSEVAHHRREDSMQFPKLVGADPSELSMSNDAGFAEPSAILGSHNVHRDTEPARQAKTTSTPQVHIGQIDVIVTTVTTTPDNVPRRKPSTSDRHVASRSYLRRL